MFDTTRDNAGVVGVYGDPVPYPPVATSAAVEVCHPHDTDFSLFRHARRVSGLNSPQMCDPPLTWAER